MVIITPIRFFLFSNTAFNFLRAVNRLFLIFSFFAEFPKVYAKQGVNIVASHSKNSLTGKRILSEGGKKYEAAVFGINILFSLFTSKVGKSFGSKIVRPTRTQQ